MTDLRQADIALVTEKFRTSQEYAANAYQAAMTAINLLLAIAPSLELINRVIPIDTTQINPAAVPDNALLADINRPVPIDTTTISPKDLSSDPPTIDMSQFTIQRPALPGDPQVVDATLGTIPTFPTTPTNKNISQPNENYYSYSRTLLDAIRAKILTDLTNGSSGLSDAVEDALFKREYERSLLEEKDLEDGIASEWSSRGWPLPSGALLAGINQAKINFANKRLDISRDVMFKSWELAYQNYHFIIQYGIGFEGELLKWAHGVADLAYQASKALVDTDLEIFTGLTQSASERAKVVIAEQAGKIAYNKNQIDYKIAQLETYNSFFKGESDRVNAVARGYEAKTSVFKSVTDFDIARAGLDLKVLDSRSNQAVSNANIFIKDKETLVKAFEVLYGFEISKSGLDIKVLEARMQQAAANSNIMIKDKEIEMKNYELLNNLMAETLKAAGAIAAQLVSGALSAVSASAGISATSQSSYSYVESHQFSEE